MRVFSNSIGPKNSAPHTSCQSWAQDLKHEEGLSHREATLLRAGSESVGTIRSPRRGRALRKPSQRSSSLLADPELSLIL